MYIVKVGRWYVVPVDIFEMMFKNNEKVLVIS